MEKKQGRNSTQEAAQELFEILWKAILLQYVFLIRLCPRELSTSFYRS